MTLNDFKSVEGDRRMGIDSLPVLLGVERAARVACLFMAVPQLVVVALLLAWGDPIHAAIVGLPAARVRSRLMRRMLRSPTRQRAALQRHRHHASTSWACSPPPAPCASLPACHDAAPLGWLGIVRLGLVQTALGAIVVLTTSTLNRVMVVELALPATLPGALVAMHYAVQVLRPRLGYGSDVSGRAHALDHRRHGDAVHGRPARRPRHRLDDHEPWAGIALAVLAFLHDRHRRRARPAPRSWCCSPSAWSTSGARRPPPSSG